MELGTGTTDFEELADESELVLVAGPQGGHHFIAHARMYGLAPGDPSMPGTVQNPTTRFTVWSESGDQLDIAPPPYRLGYEEVGDDIFALASGHIIQVREEEVAAMYGTRVRLAVELTDANGARVTDERWVTAIEDPAEPPDAWVEIGTGDGGPFEPIAEESDLLLDAGPQGGRHFYLHARMMGLVPEGPTTRFRVYDEGGDRVDLSGDVPLDYQDAGGGTYALPNEVVVQVNDDLVAAGTRVRITVELTDVDGLSDTDQRWVRAVDP